MKKVLVVDDNEQNTYMLKVLLQGYGYQVLTAHNGQDALEKADKTLPDLIISDILMPGMDGFALCRHWKKTAKFNQIPFIFYTATYTDPKDEAFALSLGADRFLIKPIEPEILMENIERVVSEHDAGKIGIKEAAESTSEESILQSYNERLINKLEQKMVQLETSNQHLTYFFEASSALTTLKPKDEIIRNGLKIISKTFNNAKTLLYSYDPETEEFNLQDCYGYQSNQIASIKQTLSTSRSSPADWIEKIYENLEPVIIHDPLKEFEWLKTQEGNNTVCIVPMSYEDRLLGIILLFHEVVDVHSKQCAQDLVTLVNNLSIAIRNADLYHQAQEEISRRKLAESRIQKQLQRLAALRKIDQVITASYNLAIIFDVFLDQVISQLGVDAAAICTFEKNTYNLEYQAIHGFRKHSLLHTNMMLGEGFAGKIVASRKPIYLQNFNQSKIPEINARHFDLEDFHAYFGIPAIAKGEIQGVLEVFHRSPVNPDREWVEYFETLAGQLAIAIDSINIFDNLQRSNTELNMAYDSTLEGWAKALELRDGETEGHSRRMIDLTIKLARVFGLSESEIVHVRRGVLLHDIGKMAIPDNILLKKEKLTDDEWEIIRQHPANAYKMLSPIGYLRPALDLPYCHHEKWDGSGYPRGLKGEEIPLTARIFSIVDVWDALSSDRPYREAWTEDRVIEYIQEKSGEYFDPLVVRKFLEII